MLDDARKICSVNYYLNNKIRKHFRDNFDEVRTIQSAYGELGEIIYHIFDSANYWLDIMSGQEELLQSYEELKSPRDFFTEWEKVDKRLIEYVEQNNSKENLTRTIHVQFSPEEEFDTTVEDLLMHISHHSMYHRSTLGALIRIHGLDPLPHSTWAFAK